MMSQKNIIRMIGAGILIIVPYYVWTESMPATSMLLIAGATMAITIMLTLLVNTSDRARELVLRLATKIPGWEGGGDIPTSMLTLSFTAGIGIIFGLSIYTGLVHYFQTELIRAYCTRDAVGVLLTAEPGGFAGISVQERGEADCRNPRPPDFAAKAPRLEADYLYKVLRRLGLLSPDEIKAGPKALVVEKDSTAAERGKPNRFVAEVVGRKTPEGYGLGASTLDLVIALSRTDKSDLQFPSVELVWTRTVLAHILARAPESLGWAPELQTLNQPMRCSWNTVIEDCLYEAESHVKKIQLHFSQGLIMHLPGEPAAYQIVGKLDTWVSGSTPKTNKDMPDGDELASQEAIPRFQAALLDALRDDELVRKWRMYLNAMVGPERALILILAFWFITLTLVRAIQMIPHRAHAIAIRKYLIELEKKWQNKVPVVSCRYKDANKLLKDLNDMTTGTPEFVTIPLKLVEAAVREMASRPDVQKITSLQDGSDTPNIETASAPDARAIETAAEGLCGKLSHSRLIFDVLLPTFPAIGFVGTVTSLLVAMSKADQIVKATDPLARGVATAAVTDILSLCFAATLLALLCLIVLAPLSLWQSAHEQRLVNDTEHLLQEVLKPEQP